MLKFCCLPQSPISSLQTYPKYSQSKNTHLLTAREKTHVKVHAYISKLIRLNYRICPNTSHSLRCFCSKPPRTCPLQTSRQWLRAITSCWKLTQCPSHSPHLPISGSHFSFARQSRDLHGSSFSVNNYYSTSACPPEFQHVIFRSPTDHIGLSSRCRRIRCIRS